MTSQLTAHRKQQDPNAALDLVSARPPTANADASAQNLQKSSTPDDADVDLARARDLLDLHANVKLAHRAGLDHSLLQARQDVKRALERV